MVDIRAGQLCHRALRFASLWRDARHCQRGAGSARCVEVLAVVHGQTKAETNGHNPSAVAHRSLPSGVCQKESPSGPARASSQPGLCSSCCHSFELARGEEYGHERASTTRLPAKHEPSELPIQRDGWLRRSAAERL